MDFSILKNLRGKWGITAQELAGRTNLTRATIARLEGGEGNPTIETVEALAQAFRLTASELIQLAEGAGCEKAAVKTFATDRFEGVHIVFPNFEIYQIRADSGVRKDSDPSRHENTAEVCLVLSGRVKATIAGQEHELGPGMAIRFRAMHEHYFDILEKAQFLLIHHVLI
jgi:transcriptional regulator with XRE-family HTH domain